MLITPNNTWGAQPCVERARHVPAERAEGLTAAVGVRGLGRAVLQAVQDLPFAHVAVANQQELEQVVVALDRAALAAHPDPHQGRQKHRWGGCKLFLSAGGRAPHSHPGCRRKNHPKSNVPYPIHSLVEYQRFFGFFTLKSSADTKNVFQRWDASSPPKTRMGIVWTQVMLSRGQIWCQQLVVSIKPVTDRL